MTPRYRITTEDCIAAHAERLEENDRQLKENRYYNEALTAHEKELTLKVAGVQPEPK